MCEGKLQKKMSTTKDSVLTYNDDPSKSEQSIGKALTLMNYERAESTKSADYMGRTIEQCPVSKCTLKTVGCINDYIGNKITINPDFEVSAIVNSKEGYNEKFCIVCTISYSYS